nr:MAG TPA: Protocadherin-15, LHFPL tetraspan subfamily member, LHFPL5, protocadherin, tip link [Bacteriophage sp.]
MATIIATIAILITIFFIFLTSLVFYLCKYTKN